MDFRPYASSSAGNLYAVESGRDVLLIDPGLRMAEIRQALGFGVSRACGCLITHSHGDHARAAPDMLRAGVDCYASSGTWEALGVRGHHRAHSLAPRQEVGIGPFRVLPFDTRHDAEGSLGFLIGAPDGDRLLFAVDTAYLPYRVANLTHIAVEANFSAEALSASPAHPARKLRTMRSHMSIERLVEALKSNDLSRVREIHLLHMSADHGDGAAFRAAVQRATGKPTYVAPRDWRTKR